MKLEESLDYLAWIRGQRCVLSGSSITIAHHMDTVGHGRSRKKPMLEHFSAVPLSQDEHYKVHNQKGYLETNGLTLWKAVWQFNKLWESER